MEETIKISVLIPAYNVERYIDQCLESVMNQTLRDIEIIITDDGSTDATFSHIEAAAARDTRIRVIRHDENRSSFQSRKDAVLASRGEYIMFVDADDYIELNACELVYAKAAKTQTDILLYGAVVENCGNLPKRTIDSMQNTLDRYLTETIEEPFVTACYDKRQMSFTLWQKACRSTIAKSAFGRMEDGNISAAEDSYASFALLMESRRLEKTPERLYHYCYGRGACGKNELSLENFNYHCGQARIWDRLDRYVSAMERILPGERAEQIEAAREAAEIEKRRSKRRLINRWLNRVRPEDRPAAFLVLEAAFQMDGSDFIGQLAQEAWGKRKEVAEALAGADYLRYSGRPVKTIALYYYKLRNGGVERVVALLSSLLAECRDENGEPRYKVVVVTEEEPNEDDYPVSPLVIRECIPRREDSVEEKYPPRAAAWARIVRQHGVDVVLYSQWRTIQQVWDILSIKRTERRPAVVFHTHSWFATMYMEKADRIDERKRIFHLADGVVALSEKDRVYWSRVAPRVYKIPNPCFIKASEVNRSRFGKHILWIARIHEQKQPLEIPRIMREVIARDPEIVCHVVGDQDPKLRAKLERAILVEGLSDNVILEGFHPNVVPFYESCSLFLMTSREEGFALTLYEAACYGMPTVMYELPWLSYCTDMEGWVSVPQLDANAAAEAVVRIVNDPAEWQMRSDALYQSALNYEQTDITGYWLSLLSDLEQGRVPEYPEIDSTTKIFLDQLDYFHGIAIRGLVKEKNTHQKRVVELEGLLEASLSSEKKAKREAKKAKTAVEQAQEKATEAREREEKALADAAEAKAAEQQAIEKEAKARKAEKKAKEAEKKAREAGALAVENEGRAREREEKALADAAEARAAEQLALEREAKARAAEKKAREAEKKAREAEKKLREKLNRIENSRTYRLARLLGKPVRLLKKISSSGKKHK